MRSTVIEAQKSKAHRQMMIEDGATPAGDDPPVEHLRALEQAANAEQIGAVHEAHRNGRAPPELPNNSNRGNQGGPP
jgi:hypothetical protein